MPRASNFPARRNVSTGIVAVFVVLVYSLHAASGSLVAYILPKAARNSRNSAEAALGRRGLLASLGVLGTAKADTAWAALKADELRATNLFLASAPSVIGVQDGPDSLNLPKGSVTGTGFVWDGTHVVTNYHVIEGLKEPHITFLKSEAELGASDEDQHVTVGTYVVGSDPVSDIAVLQVKTDEAGTDQLMRPLQRGVSSILLPGQEVYALGNPFGLEHSMSKGVISGLARKMEGGMGRPMYGIIQTDASINPGNSGGPLLDGEGKVIGMNTAIVSTTGTFGGVGFAVPIDTVAQNVNSMIAEGYVSRPTLGVEFAPDALSSSLGAGGAMVMKVMPGGPAQRAGLRATRRGQFGDVIVNIGGKTVSKAEDVFTVLDKQRPGDLVKMSVRRPSADVLSDRFDEVDVTLRLGLGKSSPSRQKMMMT